MKVGTIRERLLQRIGQVLQDGSTEEVFLVADQLRVVAGALAALNDDDDVDLSGYTIDTTRAAQTLSYHAEHVRRLIRQGTMRAAKVGADYRIPLTEIFAVLVRRHRDEPPPALLPSLEGEAASQAALTGKDLHLAIDVSIVQGQERQPIRIQRFVIGLQDLLPGEPPAVNGEAAERTPTPS